jgi:hypothetical protein
MNQSIMQRRNRSVLSVFQRIGLFSLLLLVAACESGTDPGGVATTLGSFLKGTVVLGGSTTTTGSGKPLFAASTETTEGLDVTIKDKNGLVKTGKTIAGGAYNISVEGLTPPLLIRVVTPGGKILYSVGGETGIANVHPLTQMIIKTWYKAQGKTIEQAFDDPKSAPPPTPLEVKIIASVVRELVSHLFDRLGVPKGFDLISTEFVANNAGIDRLLDVIALNESTGRLDLNVGALGVLGTALTDTQTAILVVNPDRTVTSSRTTIVNGVQTTDTTRIVITAGDTVLFEVAETFKRLSDTAKAKGPLLVPADMLPFFDAGFLHDGDNASTMSGEFAEFLKMSQVLSVQFDRVVDYNATSGVIKIEGSIAINEAGVAGTEPIGGPGATDPVHILKKQADGAWRFYGNQRVARVDVQLAVENNMSDLLCLGCSGTSTILQFHANAATGTIKSITVTGSDGKSYIMGKQMFNEMNGDNFEYPICCPFPKLDVLPPPGTTYTFTITLASGAIRKYTIPLPAVSREVLAFTSPTGHLLADAKLGMSLHLAWNPIFSFQVGGTHLSWHLESQSITGERHQCHDGKEIMGEGMTSTDVILPSFCMGHPVKFANLHLSVHGEGGQTLGVSYSFSDYSKVALPGGVAATIKISPCDYSATSTAGSCTVALNAGEQRSFYASVFGLPDPGVLWSIMEGARGGSISPEGFYTATTTSGTFILVAKSRLDTAIQAKVTVTVSLPAQAISGMITGGTICGNVSASGVTAAGLYVNSYAQIKGDGSYILPAVSGVTYGVGINGSTGTCSSSGSTPTDPSTQPAGSFISLYEEGILVLSGEQKRIDFVLPMMHKLSGTLKQEDGTAVKDASIRVHCFDQASGSKGGGEVVTDLSGLFSISLPHGECEVSVSYSGIWYQTDRFLNDKDGITRAYILYRPEPTAISTQPSGWTATPSSETTTQPIS